MDYGQRETINAIIGTLEDKFTELCKFYRDEELKRADKNNLERALDSFEDTVNLLKVLMDY